MPDDLPGNLPADEALDPPRHRGPLRRFLEILVLSSFAIAQPLLDITGRSPETFVFYRVDGPRVVVYALVILLVPPVLLWLAVGAAALASAPAGRVAHAVIAGGLIALTVLQAEKKLAAARGPVLVVVALLVAAGALWLVARSAPLQSFVTYLTPAPLVFALLFVLASPTGDLVRPARAGAAAGAGADADAPTPPVVMIILDELPLVSLLDSDAEVDRRVFPNFARLAGTSHWFRNATSVAAFTSFAVPTLLTGRYPQEKLVPSYVQYPDSLFSALAPDYRIRAFETITQLCDPAVCEETQVGGGERGLGGLLGQTWQVAKKLATPYDDEESSSEQFAEQSAGTVTEPTKPSTQSKPSKPMTAPNWKTLKANQPDRFQRFLRGLRPHQAPTMHFLHLLLPHHPWRYLPSGATHPDRVLGGAKEGGWVDQPWPSVVNRQAMLLQLAYTDRLLGEVIDRLQKQGMWDDSLVVVTADHGEALFGGGSGRHLQKNAESQAQLAWVPVFLKVPGQTIGTTSDANWEQVDLLPTIADALDRKLAFEVDGISLLSGSRTRTVKYFYNVPGKRVVFAGAPGYQIVRAGVTDTFVNGAEGPDGLYRVGRHADWIGRSVSSLASLGVHVAGAPSPMSAHLSGDVDLGAVDLASGSVPSLLTGTLRRSRGRGPVLLAVNGTVGAVSEIYPQDDRPSFAGIVDEKLFTNGANDLRLYEVVGGATPELRPLTLR